MPSLCTFVCVHSVCVCVCVCACHEICQTCCGQILGRRVFVLGSPFEKSKKV